MRTIDHALLLQQAARKLGGEELLRSALGVSWLELQDWLHAGSPVPTAVFLRLVDVLSADNGAPVERRAAKPAHPFLDDPTPGSDVDEIVERALDAALDAADADFGNVQLLDANGVLRIRAQRGFEAPFLEFFAAVSGPESVCGVAMMTGKQFNVPDVARSDVLSGVVGEKLLAAGVRAVQSTPIVTPARKLIGMLSVHYRQPGTPDERAMALLAAIARRTAALLAARK